jgi:hypothetical protein
VVKIPQTVKIAGNFEAAALRVLRSIPGLTVVAEPRVAGGRPDALVHFAGTNVSVLTEFKTRANTATAWQLVHYAAAHPDTPVLLIAEETTDAARDILAEHDIAVVDALGNAHIALPGLLMHLEARRRSSEKTAAGPARLRGKAGVVAQALLLDTARPWQVHDLANLASVSDGLTHRVLVRLEREGIVAAEGTGPKRFRRVADPTALLDLWTEEATERFDRILGFALAPTPKRLITKLGAGLDRACIDHAVTGSAAASLVAPFTTAVPVVDMWVSATASAEELMAACKADAVSEGHNIVFLQAKDDTPLAFRERTQGSWLANRFRIYADLRGDPRRGREQAEHLRHEVIGF